MDEDRPCDVCGSLFNDDLIETCSTCNIREHRYCMKKVRRSVPDNWECDSCKKDRENRLASSAGSVHHDVMHHSRRQKTAETGKVKFLTNDEAIRLASGVKAMESQRSFNSKHSNSNFMAPIPPRTPIKPKSVTPKSPSASIKANPSTIPLRTEMSPRHGTKVKMQSISTLIQQTSPIQKDPKEPMASIAQNSKKHGTSAPLAVEISPAKEVRPSKLIIQNDGAELRDAEPKASLGQNSKKHSSGAPSPLVTEMTPAKEVRPAKLNIQNGEDEHADGKPRAAGHNHVGEELSDALKNFMSLHLNHWSLPAPDATWKGGFILDAGTPHFVGGFRAQPSYKFRDFRPKVYAFSQKMPLILKANVVPRSHIWTDVFQDECPNLQDVALYFFPSDNIERSRENNASLIELMESQGSMMRICFDGEGVELLVFTSRVLQLDSQLISFLWGIFRSTKKVQDHHKVDEVLPSMVDQANMGNSDSADMEIDMLGGEMVGRVDIVVGRDPDVARNTETSSGLKTIRGLKTDSVKEEGEISAENEKELECPPGFCKRGTQSDKCTCFKMKD